jgi:hypothetical protein
MLNGARVWICKVFCDGYGWMAGWLDRVWSWRRGQAYFIFKWTMVDFSFRFTHIVMYLCHDRGCRVRPMAVPICSFDSLSSWRFLIYGVPRVGRSAVCFGIVLDRCLNK